MASAVLCRSADEVFIAGNNGILFVGNRKGWRRLGRPDYEEIFSSMAEFQGRLYACTQSDLWTWNGRELELVETKLKGDVTFYQLCSAGPHLWATSEQEQLHHFDGKKWESLVSPESRASR